MARIFTTLFSFALLIPTDALASISFDDGIVSINTSGRDGSMGIDGGDAGDVTLQLSYADSAKTQIKIEGKAGTQQVSQVVSLATLKAISILALGGDGGRGHEGLNGRSGRDGWRGHDGCPPGDGYDGEDGTDGHNGGPGGNGGRGGIIRVLASSEQTEIILLVKAQTAPGSAGSGGAGGHGGWGGRGGDGGRNTCPKDHPNAGIHARDGRNGFSGRSGASGANGRAGKSGLLSFDVESGGAVTSYPRPFSLSVTSLKTIDDNEDGVFEPGETMSVLELQISNKGPMPTPTAQALNFIIQNSSTLVMKNAPPIAINDVIPGGSSKAVSFAKGAIVLQGVKKAEHLGEKAIINARLAINQIGQGANTESGYVFHWPVGVSAKTDSAREYFGSAETISYSLHNISTKAVGPGTSRPIEIEIVWSSPTVPGADVTATLKDGRSVVLDKPAVFTDFSIDAKGALALPLSVLVKNSKNVLTANGSLKVNLKLKDFSSGAQETIDIAKTGIFLAIDIRPLAIDRKLKFTKRTVCVFPKGSDQQEYPVAGVDFLKAKGSDKLTVNFYKDGMRSPAYLLPTFDFAPYTDLLKSSDPKLVIGFMNGMLAAATKAGDDFWEFSGCYALRK